MREGQRPQQQVLGGAFDKSDGRALGVLPDDQITIPNGLGRGALRPPRADR